MKRPCPRLNFQAPGAGGNGPARHKFALFIDYIGFLVQGYRGANVAGNAIEDVAHGKAMIGGQLNNQMLFILRNEPSFRRIEKMDALF